MANYAKIAEISDMIADMVAAQPAGEAVAFKKNLLNDLNANNMFGAMEGGIDSDTGKGKIVVKLLQDAEKPMNLSGKFNEIERTQGDVKKLKYYDSIALSIEYINKLENNSDANNFLDDGFSSVRATRSMTDVKRMNKLHQILLSRKEDFVFGFKTKNDYIKNTYISLVCALVDSVCLNIVYAEQKIQNGSLDPYKNSIVKVKLNPNSMKIFKTTDKLCNEFERGTWNKLMRAIRENYGKANEASLFDVESGFGVATESMAAVAVAITLFAALPLALTSLVYAIRCLIAIYFNVSVDLNEKCKSLKQFIDSASEIETMDDAKKKQQKASKVLGNISDFLSTKIIKEEAIANETINEINQDLNKEVYVSPEVRGEITFE